MIGAPFDRAHFVGIAESDVKRRPYGEKEVPADRAVEDQDHFPGDGKFRLHFLDDLRGVGCGKPIEEDEQVDRRIDDHEGDRGAHRRGKAGAEALRLRALEQLIEDEGAQYTRDDDDRAAAGIGPLIRRARQHREPRGDQEIDQPHRDDRPDRDARVDAGVGGAPVGRRCQHFRALVAQRVFAVCHIH